MPFPSHCLLLHFHRLKSLNEETKLNKILSLLRYVHIQHWSFQLIGIRDSDLKYFDTKYSGYLYQASGNTH